MRRPVALGVLGVTVVVVLGWMFLASRRAPSEDASVYLPRPAGTLTFNRDIAPIIHRECAPCHRPGESAPFDLIDYTDVVRHANQIVDVTSSGFMPPWLPEPQEGVVFAGDRRLTAEERGMIGQWVEEGAAEGSEADRPSPPRFPDGWQLGEPDLVLELAEPYTLAPEGEDIFRNFVYPTGIERTRYVRALEFRAASPAAVHHATIAVDRTANSRFHDRRDPEPGFDGMINSSAERPDGHMLGWVPGKLPHEVPAEISWPLEPETDLVVQLHLQPTGKTETIHPKIGLYFSERPPTRTAYMIRLGPRTLDIPAGDPDYVAEDSFVLPVDVEVLGLLPHAHYLGKRMDGWAVRPDGTRQSLILIDDWDFNWQDEYRLAEPVPLPKGSTLFMRYTFDNTRANVRNPNDPPRRVVFGPNTTDEMGDLWIQVVPDSSAELAVLDREFLRKEATANRACYEKMLEIDPSDRTVRYEYGELLARQGRIERAVEQYRRVLAEEPGHVPANAALGQALLAHGDAGAAERHFRLALEGMPELAEVHFNLGQALRVQRRFAEAVASYRTALAINGELVAAHKALADVLGAQGELDEAIAQYRTALALDPGHAQAHNNLGSLLAKRGLMDDALEHFELAVESDPSYAQAHNNLGMALAARGSIDAAIRHFRRALELRPDHEPTRRNLAMAMARREAEVAQPSESDR